MYSFNCRVNVKHRKMNTYMNTYTDKGTHFIHVSVDLEYSTYKLNYV